MEIENKNWAFSPATSAFYAYAVKDLYDAAGTWPDDAVDISDALREQFSTAIPGKIIGAVDGLPSWVDEPPPTHEEAVAAADNTKSALRATADSAISPLQDAIDLDIATDDESALLTAWKKYRVLLMRTDTATAPDITWPDVPGNSGGQ
ncbi:tail fiber protein [Enterobacter hormaechei]|nr:tail fiber assembly protein [Enterobacter hormaechei]GJL37065.1 tail fiber protein [Enterobacter hormaechei]